MVHNPTCWHFTKNNGKCFKGGRCLFLHNYPNKSGQFVSRTDDAQAPADRGGQLQATSQGDATDKNVGKNKKNDLAKQGLFQRLGEPVISSSPGANATALGLSSGLPTGAHRSVSSGEPNGLDESRSLPVCHWTLQRLAGQQTANRK